MLFQIVKVRKGLASRERKKRSPTPARRDLEVAVAKKGIGKSTTELDLLRIAEEKMNRGTTPSARPLSLTEELEKLEQSITLTLQGIGPYFD
jgi:hypothetical protein